MPTRKRRPTSQSEPNRLSHIFWLLAGQEASSELRDPDWVVKHWLAAVDGLEGRRSDQGTAQHALSFLMRLEKDPFYASPEQTRGGHKDSRALVYSLALLLFERLTGHHPFVESLSPLECRIQQDRARRVGKNNLCHLPGSLRAILNRALSPFPEDRFDDIASLRRALDNWQRRDQSADSVPAAPRPRAQGTSPHRVQAAPRGTPPPPPSAFPANDTLQGAVQVQSAPASRAGAQAPTSRAPAPWLWPSLSGAFAVVAALAIFVAIQSHRNSDPAGENAVSSADTQATTPGPEARVELVADEVIVNRPAAAGEESQAEEADPLPASDEQIVALVRECASSQMLQGGLSMGVSLLFDGEGEVKRSFTGRLPLSAPAASCLREGLERVVARDQAYLGRMMSYDLYVSPQGERVRVRPAQD